MMILVGSCTSDDRAAQATVEAAPSATAAFDDVPVVDPDTTSASVIPATSDIEVSGVLPDGTEYTVGFDRPVDAVVEGINGVVMVDVDGVAQVMGITRFGSNGGPSEAKLDGLDYTAPAGGGSVSIAVYPEVAASVPDLAALMASSITPGVGTTMPTLRLSPPLRWATDDEVPIAMEVLYEAFVVQRGCGRLAVACSGTGAVQVISADQLRTPADPLAAEPVWIEASEPAADCRPAVFASGRPNPDARADSADDIEVWGLFYPATVGELEGEPVAIDATDMGLDSPIRETKIVWRATGETEDFAVIGRSPSGDLVEPIWQKRHTDSLWERPGDEWGTGWVLTEPGCWTFVITRDAASAEFTIEVRDT